MRQEQRELGAVKLNIDKRLNGLWLIDSEIGGQRRQIPIYSWREDSHKRDIAMAIAKGQVGVVFGVGNYGMVKAVADPRRGRHYDSGDRFFSEKIGRQNYSKIPIYAPPKFWDRYLDRRKIHTAARGLFTYENLKRFYNAVTICHIVAPTYDRIPSLDPIFVTTKQDWVNAGKNPEDWVDQRTVSLFWWDDPDGAEVADLVARYDLSLTVGISSFNDHREKPAFTSEDVINYILNKGRVPFDFAVRDDIGETVGVRSSHPQFRVPLVGEEPVWTAVRLGSVSVDKFQKATGLSLPVRILPSTTIAARDWPNDLNLDDRVEQVKLAVEADWQNRHPKKGFSLI